MKALIDGDIILYSVGFASERRYYQCSDGFICKSAKEAKEHCFNTEAHTYILHRDPAPDYVWMGNANAMLKSIVDKTNADEYILYFTGKDNFRETLYPEYKANRKDADKPLHHEELFAWLLETHPCEIIDGMEADDALGINQSDDTILCSLDKDLDMIAGKHYNWSKQLSYEVTQREADKHFWIQLLTGDITDNIIGLKGIGPVKAVKILELSKDNIDMYAACCHVYGWHGRPMEDLYLNAELLWIRRHDLFSWVDLLNG